MILDYLPQRYRDFGPRSETERREILRWTLWDNHKLTSYSRPCASCALLPEEQTRPAVIAFFYGAGLALKVLDRHLPTAPGSRADRLTTADLSPSAISTSRELTFDSTTQCRALAERDRRLARLEAPL